MSHWTDEELINVITACITDAFWDNFEGYNEAKARFENGEFTAEDHEYWGTNEDDDEFDPKNVNRGSSKYCLYIDEYESFFVSSHEEKGFVRECYNIEDFGVGYEFFDDMVDYQSLFAAIEPLVRDNIHDWRETVEVAYDNLMNN